MRTSTTATVLAATVLAATGTAGAASGGQAPRSCRPAWTVVSAPPVPGSQGAASGVSAGIDSVTAVSARNVWFSAAVDSPSVRPWVLRWDGTRIRPVTQVPQIPLDGQDGGAGSFDSASDGWVLATNAYATPPGMGGHDDGFASTSAERWHGGRWTMTPLAVSPHPLTIGTEVADVSSASPASAWAVGLFYEAKPGVTAGAVPTGALIEHWDGTSWSIAANPASARRGGELSALTVVSPENIWAVGREENASGTVIPLAEHWDGKSWSIIPVPAGAPPSALYAVSASGGDVWAVGDQTEHGTQGVAVPLAEHWNGRSWAVAGLPRVGNALLTGVYAASPADVWATVERPSGVRAILLHLEGSAWTAVPAPGVQEYGLIYYYAGIGGTGSRDIWAVGTVSGFAADNPFIAHLRCG